MFFFLMILTIVFSVFVFVTSLINGEWLVTFGCLFALVNVIAICKYEMGKVIDE